MVYFSRKVKNEKTAKQLKSMIDIGNFQYIKPAKIIEYAASMCIASDFELALKIIGFVNKSELDENNLVFYYETLISIQASQKNLYELVKILKEYCELNSKEATEMLCEYFINNSNEIGDSSILIDFTNEVNDDQMFVDYITIVGLYLFNDYKQIVEIAKKYFNKEVALDYQHQKYFYEIVLIACKELNDLDSTKVVMADVEEFDLHFHAILTKHGVSPVSFMHLNANRTERNAIIQSKRIFIALWIGFILLMLAIIF